MKEPLDSPGCTLPQTMIHFFLFDFYYSFSGYVIESIEMGKPPNDIHKVECFIIFFPDLNNFYFNFFLLALLLLSACLNTYKERNMILEFHHFTTKSKSRKIVPIA